MTSSVPDNTHHPEGLGHSQGLHVPGSGLGSRQTFRNSTLTCCRHRSRDKALRSLSFCLVLVIVSLIMSPKWW